MSNVWQKFKNLLETDAIEVATVIESDGQRSTVELLSGERLKVIGDGTPGGKVYIKGQRIEAEAPALPQFNLILY